MTCRDPELGQPATEPAHGNIRRTLPELPFWDARRLAGEGNGTPILFAPAMNPIGPGNQFAEPGGGWGLVAEPAGQALGATRAGGCSDAPVLG